VDIFGHNNLVIAFPFNLVRHPMYLGILLSLATATTFYSQKVLLNLICLVLYIDLGSYYEEKQLVRIFGVQYEKYQRHTSKYIPVRWLTGLGRT
jgi:protein-S-isoprenylcysteine O-methyltransferase Ste14